MHAQDNYLLFSNRISTDKCGNVFFFFEELFVEWIKIQKKRPRRYKKNTEITINAFIMLCTL